MSDYLTDDDITATSSEEDSGLYGPPFYGTGLVINEHGQMVIVHALGEIKDWEAYYLGDSEGANLATMIQSVIE